MLIFTRTACQLHIGSRWRKKGGVRRETDQKQDSDLNMIDSGLLDCCLFYLFPYFGGFNKTVCMRNRFIL